MNDHVQRNAESRARLISASQQLSDAQLARIAFAGWTVSAVRAHLAFWDRITLARWNAFEKDHQPISMIDDVVNTAGVADRLSIPPREAVRLGLEAAEAVDTRIEMLPR